MADSCNRWWRLWRLKLKSDDWALKTLAALPDLTKRSVWLRATVAVSVATLGASVAMLTHGRIDGVSDEVMLLAVSAVAWICGTCGGFLSVFVGSLLTALLPLSPAASPSPDEPYHIALAVIDTVALLMVAWLSGTARGLLRLKAKRNEALRQEIAAREVLESRMAETNLQLTSANADLATAVKARDRFLANMSHEIRSPLNGVLGLLRILSQTELSPRQREFGDGAYRSAERLLRLVNGLLDTGLSAPTLIDVESTPFDLSVVIRETVATYTALALEKGIVLSGWYGERVPRFVVGPQRAIEQILNNLITNAIKFTDRGGTVWLLVEGEMHVGGAADFRIIVADSGCGMSPEQVACVFDGTGRADPLERERRNGAGLGLGIARELATGMGGALHVTSTPGVGSRFAFSVRFAVDRRRRSFSAVAHSPALQGVLVVGDNSGEAIALQEMLRRKHFWVDSAENPADACELLQSMHAGRNYDLVLVMTSSVCENPALLAELGKQGCAVITVGLDDEAVRCMSSSGCPPRSSCDTGQILEIVKRSCELLQSLPGSNERLKAGAAPSDHAVCNTTGAAARALIVDDEPLNQLVLREYLLMLGVESESVDSGELAINRLMRGRFCIVFMDKRMPLLTGPDTARRIRHNERVAGRSPVPIVATSANVSSADHQEFLASGMNDVLPKPINPAELAAVLGRWNIRPGSDAHDTNADRAHESTEQGIDDLMQIFESSGARRIHDLQSCTASGDLEAASLAAHTLKSMARHMGFHELANETAWLEDNVAQADPASAAAAVERAAALFARAIAQPAETQDSPPATAAAKDAKNHEKTVQVFATNSR